jgi:hypothetical protein
MGIVFSTYGHVVDMQGWRDIRMTPLPQNTLVAGLFMSCVRTTYRQARVWGRFWRFGRAAGATSGAVAAMAAHAHKRADHAVY